MSLIVDLVDPFHGGSHRAWAEGWAQWSAHEVRLHTLPAAAWRWRMRGAALTLAPSLRETARTLGPPDVLVVTDMVDLADLRARTMTTHSRVPAVLYLHENQLTYPRQPGEPLDAGLAWITWRNLTLADEIWCNSAFHRDEILGALPEFLATVPDQPHTDLLASVAARVRVQHPGVDIPSRRTRREPPLIVSNQRWHHDKDVEAVVRALLGMAGEGAEFRAAVIGDHEGGRAAVIDPLLDQLAGRVVARGHQPRPRYTELLGAADIVVSAARNEFFGIAVVEAVGAGALPVLPRALAYPEVIPAAYHDAVFYERGELRRRLAGALDNLGEHRGAIGGLATAMRRFSWDVAAPSHDQALVELAESGPTGEH